MNSDVLDIIRNLSFDRNALNHQADENGSGRVVVEKDFVISIILMLISELPVFSSYSDKMAFKGGTCIRKVFYPHETRFSEDLDFTNLTIEESRSFFEAINSLTRKNLGVTTFERTEIEYQNERGLDFILYYSSVLQQRNHIVFNLSTSSPLEEATMMKVDVAPYFHKNPNVLALSLNEISRRKDSCSAATEEA